MDWIEEVIHRLKKKIASSSLQTGLLLTIFISMVAAVVAFAFTRNLIYGWICVVTNRYTTVDSITNMHVFASNTGMPLHVWIGICILKLLYEYGLVLYILLAEYIGVKWYCKNRMMPGLESVQTAVGYLTLGDLGHEKNYFYENEVGRICSEIEKLRQQMLAAKRIEWEQQEEQSCVNAAFAHDLRTPLTVMKGYTDFLIKYQPEGKVSEETLLDKLVIIRQQQERLLEFSKTMAEIQNIEQQEVHCKWMAYIDYLTSLQMTIVEMGKQSGKQVSFHIDQKYEKDLQISIDPNIIMEVCENLISNALRFAKSQVQVNVRIHNQYLQCYVEDDGKGFSVNALKEGKKLYFSEEKRSSNHFGMGLYISEKLCKKHGGTLTLINSAEGGAICGAEFKIIMK